MNQQKLSLYLFGGKILPEQTKIIDAIVNECTLQEVTDSRQIAYCLATTYWECYNWNKGFAGRMVQLEEMGGEQYLKSHDYYPYYGRGPSHLTWKRNYEKEGKRLGLDLVNNPDLMLDIKIGANSHVYCMSHGTYTGHKLDDFISNGKCDFSAARKIINPKDFKSYFPISEIATKFLNAMT